MMFTKKQKSLLSNACLLYGKDREFFENVRKQGWCSEKQEVVMEKIWKTNEDSYVCGGKDLDEYYDCGYQSHPGQYDGELL